MTCMLDEPHLHTHASLQDINRFQLIPNVTVCMDEPVIEHNYRLLGVDQAALNAQNLTWR